MTTDDLKELRKPKPFDAFSHAELLEKAATLLAQLPKTLMEAQFSALIEPLSYIWANLDKRHRTQLNQMLTAHCPDLQVIRWLPKLKARIEKQRYTATKGGHGHVYFILLDRTDVVSSDCNSGLYIGQSKYSPQRRFEHHKSGRHASIVVQKHGQFVLESLSYTFAPISREEAIRIEALLLNELRQANLSNLPKKLIEGH